jgi:hypothetical protein
MKRRAFTPKETSFSKGMFDLFIICLPILFVAALVLVVYFVTKSTENQVWNGFVPALAQIFPNVAFQWSMKTIPGIKSNWPFQKETTASENLEGGEEGGIVAQFLNFFDETEYLGAQEMLNKNRVPNEMVKSTLDQNSYPVAKGLPNVDRAANLLAEVVRRSQAVLQEVNRRTAEKKPVKHKGKDITSNMKTLVSKHFQKPIPLSEYHNPRNKTIGANTGKGKKIEMCLRSKSNPSNFEPINTLIRVHLHELAHSADDKYRKNGPENHGPQFQNLHSFLLKVAEELNLYSCAEYKKGSQTCCDLKINENYCG